MTKQEEIEGVVEVFNSQNRSIMSSETLSKWPKAGLLGFYKLTEEADKKGGVHHKEVMYFVHQKLKDKEDDKPIDFNLFLSELQVRDYLDSLEDFEVEEPILGRPVIAI